MANDKLFQKRKAKTKRDLERRKVSRKKVLIVCEDSVSAPGYFEQLIEYYGLTTTKVEICGKECGSAPSNVVQYGEKKLKETGNDFDFVFFVFDRDEHPTYENALAKIEGLRKKRAYKSISIQAITSVPCFELWLKLHFDGSSKAYARSGKKSPADMLIDDLKQLDAFKNYTKDSKCSYFDDIKDHIDTAIRNAEILLNNGLETEDNKHHVNPSTLIHELVKVLRDEIKPK